jgi:restriction endonuclease S subunit
VLNNSLSFFVSNNGKDYQPALLGKEIKFPINSEGLYYRLEAKAKSGFKHYSPWIDGLTSISYAWWE